MARSVRKNPMLEQRLKELEAEISAVKRTARMVDKEGRKNPFDWVATLHRVWPGREDLPPPSPPPSLESREEPVTDSGGAREQEVAADVPIQTESVAERPAAGLADGQRIRRNDERFASYFITGGIHGMQPLQRERNIIRNRAIVLIIVVLFLLVSIYFMYF